jgi:hypothetical protein
LGVSVGKRPNDNRDTDSDQAPVSRRHAAENAGRKEVTTMRYLVALLTLGISVASSVPAVHAGENNGGDVCYTNGVALSCVQPAQLTLNTGGDAGAIAGPTTPNANPFFGGDRGN